MKEIKYRCIAIMSPDGWYWYKCDRPAKYILPRGNKEGKSLCGIHARKYNKEELKKIGEKNELGTKI